MDPALFTLLRLQFRSVLRRMRRSLGSTRGVIYLVIGLAVGVLWLGPRIIMGARAPDPDDAQLLAFYPLVLLSICTMTLLTNGGGKAFYFTPAEVDFLFPGPFQRRQVLAYKIAKSVSAALLGSLFFSCFLLIRVHHWLAGYVAVFLSLVFLQMFSMSLTLIGQTVGARAVTRGRQALLAVVAIGVGLLLWRWMPSASGPVTKQSFLKWVHDSQAAQIMLAPFAVFGKIAASRHLATELPLRAAVGVLIDVALMLTVLALDADYMEASAAHSARAHARRLRARSGQGFLSSKVVTGIRIPTFGHLAGVGPLAWRQCTGAARTARTTLLFFFVACLLAPAFIQRFLQTDPLAATLSIAAWLTFFTTNLLRFDFRGDLEQMDVLKSLPVKASAVVIGEVAAPVTILSAMHFCLLAGLAVIAPDHRIITLAAAILVVPVNLLFALLENYIFLLFPVREMTVSPGDLQGTGRRMVVLVTKLLGVLIAGAIAASAGALTYAYLGQLLLLSCLVAAIVLTGCGVAMVPLLARAFSRFDPAVDTPV